MSNALFMPTSTLTRKGQTTIPKKIREHLGIGSGDRLEYTVDVDGRVILTPSTADISELDGLLARRRKEPVSVEEMQRAVEREAARSIRKGP